MSITTKTYKELDNEFSAKGRPKERPQSVPLEEYKKYDLTPGRNITVQIPILEMRLIKCIARGHYIFAPASTASDYILSQERSD
jgi:hypothetical protein